MLDKFEQHAIPLDAVHFDIDYMSGYRSFTVEQKSFPDLPDLLTEMHQRNKRAVFILDPGVKIDSDYKLYQGLLAEGAILRKSDSAPLKIAAWPGDCVLPDFGAASSSRLWAETVREWLSLYPGDGFWNDMNEPANWNGGNAATVAAHTERGPFADECNLYGMGMAQATLQGWQEHCPGTRPMMLSRSGYPGVQRSAGVWQGDNNSWWEHLKNAIHTAVSYAICGMYFNGADLPGFAGHAPDDLAVRFFQLGAFLPLFRGHRDIFSHNKEPFEFGQEAQLLITDAIKLRYSLLREWYSYYERAWRTREPLLMPVFTDTGVLIQDQFLLFDKYLVAPVVERDQPVRCIYLPRGDWYPLGNPDNLLSGDTFITKAVTLACCPVYVRAGSIVCRCGPAMDSSTALHSKESYEVYPNREARASGYWYNDDLCSFPARDVERRELRWEQGRSSVERVKLD